MYLTRIAVLSLLACLANGQVSNSTRTTAPTSTALPTPSATKAGENPFQSLLSDASRMFSQAGIDASKLVASATSGLGQLASATPRAGESQRSISVKYQPNLALLLIPLLMCNKF
ncbi:hypothetical protein K7432_010488 [Basidiobolus ranarum]|uniref:Uncharacterized protein n=1 Tax=Basidiobolus ranarum TaxID=34480 RepID=A0ABR2VVV5_9FUNG